MEKFISENGIKCDVSHKDGKYIYLIPEDNSHYNVPIQIWFCNYGFYVDNKGTRYEKKNRF
jgi:hypothetical protein